MFSLICAWMNAWVNNHEAGDLRRHRAHYDVSVMISQSHVPQCSLTGAGDGDAALARLDKPYWFTKGDHNHYVTTTTRTMTTKFSIFYTMFCNYTIVWFLRAPRWYIGPTAMPRAAVTPIAPERSEGAIGCDSRPRHCRRDDIPAWRPNKITLLALLPLDLTMYYHFISFLRAVQFRVGH